MTDAYKIGITVALTNLVGAELTQIAKQFGVAEKSAAGFGIALGITAVAIAGVTAALVAGVKEASKFETELAKFRMYGLGDKLNEDAKNFPMNMKVAGVNFTEGMHLMNEAQGVFRQSGRSDEGALAGAKLALPTLEKLAFIDKALYGKDHGGNSPESLAMLRWIDMSGGAQDPKRFNELADLGFKLKTTSGGQIDWEGLRQFRARAKSAGFSMSDEMYAMAEPIIGELKGMTAGTSLSTAYNRAHGITKPTNQAVAEWIRLGLWDESKIQLNSLGGVKKFRGDPLLDAQGYDDNFIKWYLEHVKPAYDKAGLNKDQRIRENALLFNATGGNLMSLVDRQSALVYQSYDSVQKAHGIGATYLDALSTPAGKMTNLTGEWEKLLTNLGEIVLPAVNVALDTFIADLQVLNSLFGHGDGGADKIRPQGSWWSRFKTQNNLHWGAPPAPKKSVTLENHLHLPNGAVFSLGKQIIDLQTDEMSKAPSTGNDMDARSIWQAPGHASARGF